MFSVFSIIPNTNNDGKDLHDYVKSTREARARLL